MFKPLPPPPIGATYGRLSFVAKVDQPGRQRWLMLCSCGTSKSMNAHEVRRGKAGSCGCLARELSAERNAHMLAGQRFGRLVALERVGSSRYGNRWRCACSCGGYGVFLATKLRAGMVVSCGCAASDKPGLMPAAVRAPMVAHNAKRRAQARGAGGAFTAAQIDDLHRKQRGRCAWCRSSLEDGFHRDHRTALSNGGTNDIANIDLLCGPCNLRKGAKDVIAWAQENGRLL